MAFDRRPAATAFRAEFLAELAHQLRLAQAPIEPDGSKSWWTLVDGIYLLRLHFRGEVLTVNADADTALLYDMGEVEAVLQNVRTATQEGKLDNILYRAANTAQGYKSLRCEWIFAALCRIVAELNLTKGSDHQDHAPTFYVY